MQTVPSKYLIVLDNDIMCECKDISMGYDARNVLHNHDGYELLLLINGSLDVYSEGDGKSLGRGDLVCVKANCFHHVRLNSPGVYDRVVINFRENVLERLCTEKTDLGKCFISKGVGKLNYLHLDEEQVQRFLQYARELQAALKEGGFGADVLSYALLTQLLVMTNKCICENVLTEHKGIMPKLVSETFAYIDKHLTEELSLSVLEKQLQYNGIYISRCFKRVMGITLQQYIIAKRCSLAQQYLAKGYSPCDACFMTGFNNYSSFSRTFLQQIGVSPKKYQLMQMKTKI